VNKIVWIVKIQLEIVYPALKIDNFPHTVIVKKDIMKMNRDNAKVNNFLI
jgi:hypothetical protein